MKNFFQKNGIMMLAAVTVVAVLLCVASALSSQTGFLQNAGGVIASPFRAVGSAVSGWFSSISQRFEDVEALQQENADLKKENAELQRQLENAVGAKTNQNRQRILTQNRKLMMGGLQHDQELAADIPLDVPVVDPDLCTSCGDCAKACVTHALDLDDSGHVHTLAAYCVNCAACVKACPEGALSMRPQDARGVSPTWEVGSEEELRALIGSESFWRFSHT